MAQCTKNDAPMTKVIYLRLPKIEEKDEDVTNVYQPDLLVVCDKSGLKGTGYYGFPSLVIEIL